MRVVTYARVSTLGQETTGGSLDNQEGIGFKPYLLRSGATRIAKYVEAKSAKTIAGRAVFMQMLDDLPRLKPDAIVIDTLDRFTRNLTDGLLEIRRLGQIGVALIELEHGDEPLNIVDQWGRDWTYVAEKFLAAQVENGRRSKRMKRSYDGKRAVGASVANKSGFGVQRLPNGTFVPHPTRAAVVAAMDARFLSGATLHETWRYARSLDADAWKSALGVRRALQNGGQYIRAGVRTPEAQAAIDARLELSRARYGARRKHTHEFTGVFACATCLDAGVAVKDALLFGVVDVKSGRPYIGCDGGHSGSLQKWHRAYRLLVTEISDPWHAFFDVLADDEWIRHWASIEPNRPADHTMLMRRLHDLEQQAGKIAARESAHVDVYTSSARSAEDLADLVAAKKSVKADLLANREMQAYTKAELDKLKPRAPRNAEVLRLTLATIRRVYDRADNSERNRINRELCALVGSHPVIRRTGFLSTRRVAVTWPEIAATIRQEA